jgi:hypothetical protein
MPEPSPLIVDPNLDQIGIVVHDLHAVTQELARLFGIGPFRIFEWPLEDIDPQSTYHGQQGDFSLLLAFATVGRTQIEIIQPLEGESIFSDFLRDKGPGLHHFRLSIQNFEEGVSALVESGIEKITSGSGLHHGSKWAYFDTSAQLGGVLVELRTRLGGADGEGQWVKPGKTED